MGLARRTVDLASPVPRYAAPTANSARKRTDSIGGDGDNRERASSSSLSHTADDASYTTPRVRRKVPRSASASRPRRSLYGGKCVSDIRLVPNAECLALSSSGLTSLRGLGAHPELKQLFLQNNMLRDVVHLDVQPQLAELNLEHNRISTLKGLQPQPRLTSIYLQGNPVSRHPMYRVMVLLACGVSGALRRVDGKPLVASERQQAKKFSDKCVQAIRLGWVLDEEAAFDDVKMQTVLDQLLEEAKEDMGSKSSILSNVVSPNDESRVSTAVHSPLDEVSAVGHVTPPGKSPSPGAADTRVNASEALSLSQLSTDGVRDGGDPFEQQLIRTAYSDAEKIRMLSSTISQANPDTFTASVSSQVSIGTEREKRKNAEHRARMLAAEVRLMNRKLSQLEREKEDWIRRSVTSNEHGKALSWQGRELDAAREQIEQQQKRILAYSRELQELQREDVLLLDREALCNISAMRFGELLLLPSVAEKSQSHAVPLHAVVEAGVVFLICGGAAEMGIVPGSVLGSFSLAEITAVDFESTPHPRIDISILRMHSAVPRVFGDKGGSGDASVLVQITSMAQERVAVFYKCLRALKRSRIGAGLPQTEVGSRPLEWSWGYNHRDSVDADEQFNRDARTGTRRVDTLKLYFEQLSAGTGVQRSDSATSPVSGLANDERDLHTYDHDDVVVDGGDTGHGESASIDSVEHVSPGKSSCTPHRRSMLHGRIPAQKGSGNRRVLPVQTVSLSGNPLDASTSEPSEIVRSPEAALAAADVDRAVRATEASVGQHESTASIVPTEVDVAFAGDDEGVSGATASSSTIAADHVRGVASPRSVSGAVGEEENLGDGELVDGAGTSGADGGTSSISDVRVVEIDDIPMDDAGAYSGSEGSAAAADIGAGAVVDVDMSSSAVVGEQDGSVRDGQLGEEPSGVVAKVSKKERKRLRKEERRAKKRQKVDRGTEPPVKSRSLLGRLVSKLRLFRSRRAEAERDAGADARTSNAELDHDAAIAATTTDDHPVTSSVGGLAAPEPSEDDDGHVPAVDEDMDVPPPPAEVHHAPIDDSSPAAPETGAPLASDRVPSVASSIGDDAETANDERPDTVLDTVPHRHRDAGVVARESSTSIAGDRTGVTDDDRLAQSTVANVHIEIDTDDVDNDDHAPHVADGGANASSHRTPDDADTGADDALDAMDVQVAQEVHDEGVVDDITASEHREPSFVGANDPASSSANTASILNVEGSAVAKSHSSSTVASARARTVDIDPANGPNPIRTTGARAGTAADSPRSSASYERPPLVESPPASASPKSLPLSKLFAVLSAAEVARRMKALPKKERKVIKSDYKKYKKEQRKTEKMARKAEKLSRRMDPSLSKDIDKQINML